MRTVQTPLTSVPHLLGISMEEKKTPITPTYLLVHKKFSGDIKCAVAASTYRNYEKHWSGFKSFCSEMCYKHISCVREKHAVPYVAYWRHVRKLT